MSATLVKTMKFSVIRKQFNGKAPSGLWYNLTDGCWGELEDATAFKPGFEQALEAINRVMLGTADWKTIVENYETDNEGGYKKIS